MAAHNDFGQRAEELAARLLSRAGWTILHRNWRWRRREIDVIARRGNVVAFIEVRARRGVRHGHPLETIHWAKRLGLEFAAAAWIGRHGRDGDCYRFDAVSVCAPGGDIDRATVEHIENAWHG